MSNSNADNPAPEPVPYWEPEPGDSIRGKVVDLTRRDTTYRKDVPVVTLETESGYVDVWAHHTVLENELARRDPQIGDELEVWYDGLKAREGKKDLNMYRTANHSKVEVFDWKRGGESEPSQPSIRDAAREARSFEPPSDSYDEPFDEPSS